MTTHTPGPWLPHNETPSSNSPINRVAKLWSGGYQIIADVSYKATFGADGAEAEANACLIAAAPELLAALKADATHVHNTFECGEDRAACPVEAYKRAAIAKAEGR